MLCKYSYFIITVDCNNCVIGLIYYFLLLLKNNVIRNLTY